MDWLEFWDWRGTYVLFPFDRIPDWTENLREATEEDVRLRPDCNICLEENVMPGMMLRMGTSALATMCMDPTRGATATHVFHMGCLLPWLRDHNYCPNCMARLYEIEEGDEDEENDGVN